MVAPLEKNGYVRTTTVLYNHKCRVKDGFVWLKQLLFLNKDEAAIFSVFISLLLLTGTIYGNEVEKKNE